MKKYLTNNIALKIASVVFAIMLWLIVLNVDDPTTTRVVYNIPVTAENTNAITDRDMVYTIISGSTTSVTVTGPRSIVDKLTASDFVASADFNELSQTYAIPISVELEKGTYKDKLSIVNNSATMRLAVENIESKEFEVSIKNMGYLKDNYIVYSNKASENVVTVYAPTSVMKTIAGVKAVVVAEGQSEDFTSDINLICVDNNGREITLEGNNITFSKATVSVMSTVYYSKTVEIKENFEDILPIGYSIVESELSAGSAMIVGPKESLNAIDEILLPNENLRIEPNQKEYTIDFNLTELLPENVYAYGDVKSVTANIHIDRRIAKEFNISVSRLALTNIPDGYVASIDTRGVFSYTLVGLEEEILSYNTQDNYDVSLEDLGSGTHQVKVVVELEDGLRLERDVYVTVTLKRQEEETSNTEESSGSGQETTGTPNEPGTSNEEESTTQEETTTDDENESN